MARGKWKDDPIFKNKGPWKGGKFGSFDGGMRVPMIAYCPGIVPHATTDHQVVLYDFLTTACDMAGIEPLENDGISFVPLLEGNLEEQEVHEYMYWEGGTYMPQAQAVRMGDWFGMRQKYEEPIQLWNLKNDVSCEHNIADGNPEIVKEILEIMKREHVDSEWYQNPGETKEEIKAKWQKAIDMNSIQNAVKGNSIYPDEK
ncbi:MAG: sulfatase/phosphatase domain-containing protein, partial [Bacteroidota bacterium]